MDKLPRQEQQLNHKWLTLKFAWSDREKLASDKLRRKYRKFERLFGTPLPLEHWARQRALEADHQISSMRKDNQTKASGFSCNFLEWGRQWYELDTAPTDPPTADQVKKDNPHFGPEIRVTDPIRPYEGTFTDKFSHVITVGAHNSWISGYAGRPGEYVDARATYLWSIEKQAWVLGAN